MSARGYDIIVVTGRPPQTASVSEAWLRDNDIPYHSLIYVDKYGRGERSGGEVPAISLNELSQLRCAYAVENSGEMAAFLAEEMGQPLALLDRRGTRVSDLAIPSHAI
jgi:hypothetical protein